MKTFSFLLFVSFLIVPSSIAMAEALTAEACKEKVEEAVKLYEAEGEAALAKIKDENGPFRFAAGEGYIFVHTADAAPKMVMHPIKPALDGKDLSASADSNGKLLFISMVEMVEDNGQGWVMYSWPKPGETSPSPKVSYVKKSGNYVFGAGVYDVSVDYIESKYPEDVIDF